MAAGSIIQRVENASAADDLYKVLGVHPEAIEGEGPEDTLRRFQVLSKLPTASIKACFMATSRAIHPDKCQHPRAGVAQQLVNQAWTTLTNPVARQEHDNRHLSLLRKEVDKLHRQQAKKLQSKATDPWMKQKQALDSKQEKKAPSKAAPETKAASAKKEEPNDASFDVSGMKIKELKTAFTVKMSPSLVRKFPFNEWHSAVVAKQVAVEFAKKAASVILKFECMKTKKEKKDYTDSFLSHPAGQRVAIPILRDLLEQDGGTSFENRIGTLPRL